MTLTIRLDDRMDQAVAAAAEAYGMTKSDFVRLCLRERLQQDESSPTDWDLGKDLFGKHSSDRGDLAHNAKRIAREKIHARKGRR